MTFRRSASAYLGMLQALLPRGLAWTRDAGAGLTKTLAAAAEELARIDSAVFRLLDEILPSTTVAGLPDWERVLGLPDDCSPLAETLEERRASVLMKLVRPTGQNAAYYIQMAKAFGYNDARVEEFPPFSADVSGAEDFLNDAPNWIYAWMLRVGGDLTMRYFEIDMSSVGDPLRSWEGERMLIRKFGAEDSGAEDPLRAWGDEMLECRIRKAAPAHTVVLFGYGE